jgi:hypothetical protein
MPGKYFRFELTIYKDDNEHYLVPIDDGVDLLGDDEDIIVDYLSQALEQDKLYIGAISNISLNLDKFNLTPDSLLAILDLREILLDHDTMEAVLWTYFAENYQYPGLLSEMTPGTIANYRHFLEETVMGLTYDYLTTTIAYDYLDDFFFDVGVEGYADMLVDAVDWNDYGYDQIHYHDFFYYEIENILDSGNYPEDFMEQAFKDALQGVYPSDAVDFMEEQCKSDDSFFNLDDTEHVMLFEDMLRQFERLKEIEDDPYLIKDWIEDIYYSNIDFVETMGKDTLMQYIDEEDLFMQEPQIFLPEDKAAYYVRIPDPESPGMLILDSNIIFDIPPEMRVNND